MLLDGQDWHHVDARSCCGPVGRHVFAQDTQSFSCGEDCQGKDPATEDFQSTRKSFNVVDVSGIATNDGTNAIKCGESGTQYRENRQFLGPSKQNQSFGKRVGPISTVQ